MRTKILLLMLLVAIFVQAIGIYISYNGVNSLSDYSEKIVYDLGDQLYKKSEDAIVSRSEKYMLEIAQLQASNTNEIFDEISVDLKRVSESLKEIIKDRGQFSGHDLPLPEMTSKGSLDDKTLARGKIYAIDMGNVSIEKGLVLPYDPSFYMPKEYYDSFYRTDIESYANLSSDRRSMLEKEKIIVSNNRVPENLRNEMRIISNLDYIVKPIYENSKFIDRIYLGSNNIYYEYSIYNDKDKYLPSTKDWYIDAKNSKEGSTTWKYTQSNINNRRYIKCLLPYKSYDNRMSGVIGFDILLDKILNDTALSNFDKFDYTFVVDTKGNIVSSVANADNFSFEAEKLSNNCDELIYDMKNLSHGVKKIKYNDQNYYATYAPINSLGWSMCTLVEENEVLTPISNAKDLIGDEVEDSQEYIDDIFNKIAVLLFIEFIVIIIFAVIVSIKASKAITKPLAILSSVAKRIGSGDISHKIDIDSKDEIGDLARDFNKMTDDISMYIKELKKTTAAKERIKSTLEVAKTIQSSMLPNKFPPFPERKDIEIYAIMEPARLVGGDFYDFFFIDKDHLAVVIADVSGKGVPAALFMVEAKFLIKTQLQTGQEPGDVLSIVNNRLCENNDAGMFVTAFVGVLEVSTGFFKYSNAGHNLPLIKKDGKFEFIKAEPGFVLAGLEGFCYKTNTVTIKKGDIIYLYTDGVTEAEDKEKNLFSEERLIKTLNNLNTQDMSVENIIKDVKVSLAEFSSIKDQSDDITMLVLRRPTDI